MYVGLFLLFCRVLRGFTVLDAILPDLDIAPASTLLLDSVKHFFRDNRLVIALCGVTIHFAVVDFPLCLVFRRVSFEDMLSVSRDSGTETSKIEYKKPLREQSRKGFFLTRHQ